MFDEIIGTVPFVDGVRRQVFEDWHGKQYVLNNDGERVYGIWRVSEEEFADLPIIVEASPMSRDF
jgi:hypothetical protein